MQRKRHHVISRGYQRFFGEGERILLIDKETRHYKEVGTRDTFVEAHFNSWRNEAGWDTSLEDEWQRIEGLVLPQLRPLIEQQGGANQREAVKILAAIHFARSYVVREMQAIAGIQAVESTVLRLASDPAFVSLFVEQIGHEPEPNEIEGYIAERWADLTKSGFFLQERTVHAYQRAKDYFAPLHVQFLYARPAVDYVLGDTPIIVGDSTLSKVGLRDHLALGDAQTIWMPITRRCSMNFWGTHVQPPPDALLPPSEVQKLNWLSWRAAARFLICHPGIEPSRALATKLAPLTPYSTRSDGARLVVKYEVPQR